MTDEQSDGQSDDLYKKDLLGDPIIPKPQRRNSKRRPEPVSEPPPARPTRPRKVDVHLPKRTSFLSLVSAAIAFIAWHAYQFQFKGVMPGVETDKMPPAIYGAIVAVVCIVCFGWFLGECGSAFTRQFQTDANRPPWHRTKHRWIVPSTHLALGIVVFVCVAGFVCSAVWDSGHGSVHRGRPGHVFQTANRAHADRGSYACLGTTQRATATDATARR